MDWTCFCGAMKVRLHADNQPRIACYCRHCQRFARELGAERILDPSGGTELCQMLPDQIEFAEGAEHLAALRLTEKGPLRWYASCCNTPLANTLQTPRVPFASIILHGVKDRAGLGPVQARVNRNAATGPVPLPHGSTLRVVLAFITRTARGRLSGRWRINPFFDMRGAPVATPEYRPYKAPAT